MACVNKGTEINSTQVFSNAYEFLEGEFLKSKWAGVELFLVSSFPSSFPARSNLFKPRKNSRSVCAGGSEPVHPVTCLESTDPRGPPPRDSLRALGCLQAKRGGRK